MIVMNSFRMYCPECERWWNGWGANVCPLCRRELTEGESEKKKRIEEAEQAVLKCLL